MEHGSVTILLREYRSGNAAAFQQIVPLVYDEMRRIASSMLKRERTGHTLQATALVNEAFVKLVAPGNADVADRNHFVAIAARAMRQILVDYARAYRAEKRGGGEWDRVSLSSADGVAVDLSQAISIDEALARLAEKNERQAKVVELRFFGGLDIEETASALGISSGTVKREWTIARAWLHRELHERE